MKAGTFLYLEYEIKTYFKDRVSIKSQNCGQK